MSDDPAPALTAHPSWGRRLVGIEGLRAVAAVAVLLFHVPPILAPHTAKAFPVTGSFDNGLTLFFVLSGFLLYRPFASAILGRSRRPPMSGFLRNRVLRIWPAYLVTFLIVNYVFAASRLSQPHHGMRVGTLDPVSSLLNALLLQSFTPGTVRTGLEVSWTLSAEFCFYLALPALAAGAGAIAARVRRPVIAAIAPAAFLLVVGLATKLVFVALESGMTSKQSTAFEWGTSWSTVVARSLLATAHLFAIGMFAAVVFAAAERDPSVRSSLGRAMPLLAGLAIVTATVAVAQPRVERIAFAIAAACLVLLAIVPDATGAPNRFGRVLEWAPLRFLGVVSYGVYLWHLAVIRWMQAHDMRLPDTPWGAVGDELLVLVLAVGLASATYFGVEKQALRLKRRTDMRRTDRGAAPVSSGSRVPRGGRRTARGS